MSKKKKGLNTYLRTVSLSNGIWYAKLSGYWAKQQTFLQKQYVKYNFDSNTVNFTNTFNVKLFRVGIAGKGGIRESNLCAL